ASSRDRGIRLARMRAMTPEQRASRTVPYNRNFGASRTKPKREWNLCQFARCVSLGSRETGRRPAVGSRSPFSQNRPERRAFLRLVESIVVAVASGGLRGEAREYGRIANTATALDRLLRKLGSDGPARRRCYEAGPGRDGSSGSSEDGGAAEATGALAAIGGGRTVAGWAGAYGFPRTRSTPGRSNCWTERRASSKAAAQHRRTRWARRRSIFCTGRSAS